MLVKIFKITAYFELTSKPVWLDEFRKNFNELSKYHITFKYPTYIDGNQTSELKIKLSKMVSEFNPIKVIFDTYLFDKMASGNIIMLTAQTNESIVNLQRQIISELSSYGTNLKSGEKEYEDNFISHLTLARKMSDEDFAQAQKLLQSSIKCEAVMSEVTLTLVNNWVSSETSGPINQTAYKLGKLS